MRLIHRWTTPTDFARCFELLWDRDLVPEQDKTSVFAFWGEILKNGSGHSGLVEDLDHPPSSRIVTWGLSAFVTEAFYSDICSLKYPRLGYQAWRRWKDGYTSVLTKEQLREANSGHGVNIAVLHSAYGLNPDITDEFILQAVKLKECFIQGHKGYNIKRILNECEDERIVEGFRASGLREYGRVPLSGVDEHVRTKLQLPHFTTLNIDVREDLYTTPMGPFSQLFAYSPPRFYFNENQQALLNLAMEGGSDVDFAIVKRVTLSSVKKRWQAIYNRIAIIAPSLLSEDDPIDSFGVRGPEKRRRVLSYLQLHPEELRPINPKRIRK